MLVSDGKHEYNLYAVKNSAGNAVDTVCKVRFVKGGNWVAVSKARFNPKDKSYNLGVGQLIALYRAMATIGVTGYRHATAVEDFLDKIKKPLPVWAADVF